jgi:hypothetical protein
VDSQDSGSRLVVGSRECDDENSDSGAKEIVS